MLPTRPTKRNREDRVQAAGDPPRNCGFLSTRASLRVPDLDLHVSQICLLVDMLFFFFFSQSYYQLGVITTEGFLEKVHNCVFCFDRLTFFFLVVISLGGARFPVLLFELPGCPSLARVL